MSRFVVGNIFLVVSMASATAAHVMLKGLIDEFGGTGLDVAAIREFLTVPRLMRLVGSGALLVTGFLFWVACLTRLPLTWAYPVASATVLLIPVFSVVVLGESVSSRMWIGTVLVLVGIVLLRPNGAG